MKERIHYYSTIKAAVKAAADYGITASYGSVCKNTKSRAGISQWTIPKTGRHLYFKRIPSGMELKIETELEDGDVPCYESWGDVPEHLKTQTQIKKEGKRRRPKQAVRGYMLGYYGRYALYDITECLKKKPPTEKQKATFQAMKKKTICQQCGRRPVQLSDEGLCGGCQRKLDAQRQRSAQVIEWAQALVDGGRWVTLDTETTGLEPGKIVDIAVIDGATGDVLLNTLINPQMPIPPDVIEIHGITDEMVKDAPIFADIQTKLEAVLKDKTVVVYNVPFDRGFLEAEGLQVEVYQWECAIRAYAKYYGEWSKYFGDWKFQNLSLACSQIGVELVNAHRAAADANATRELVMTLAQQPLAGETRQRNTK